MTGEAVTGAPVNGRRGPGRTTARMASLTLTLEAFLVFFGMLGAYRLSGLPPQAVWIGGGALILLALVAAGITRRPGGLILGWLVQVLILATGFVLPAMFVMGALFVLLWWWLLRVGQKIDAPRPATP